MTPQTLYRAVALAFGLLVGVLVFPQIVGVLLLVLLVAIIAVPLSAAATALQRWGVRRAVGAPLVLVVALSLLGAIIALLVPTFISEANRLIDSLPRLLDELRRDVGHATSTSPHDVGRQAQQFVNSYTAHPGRLLGPLTSIGASVVGVLAALIVVLLTALYSAIHPDPLVSGALRLVAPPRRARARLVVERLGEAYVGWLRGLLVGMLVLGVLTYLGLLAVGLPFAIVFATLTALAMVVPYFGALFSSIPPILLALTISPGKALLVAGIYVVAHQIEGNLIAPLVMARAVKLHPALVAVGVVAAERLFGFVGLILAVPILATAKILVEELWVHPLEAGHTTPHSLQPHQAGNTHATSATL